MLKQRVHRAGRRTPHARRVGVWTVLAVLGAAALTGCGGQVGAAAVIGGVTVENSAIDAQSTELTSTSGTGTGATGSDTLAAGPAQLAARITQDRTLLTYAIWHQMLAQAAVPNPLTNEQLEQIVSDESTTSQLRTLLLATPDTLRDRVIDAVSMQQVVKEALDAGTPVTGPKVRYEYLSVQDLSTALADRTRYSADPAAWSTAVAGVADASQGGSNEATALGTGVSFISTGVFTAQPGVIVVSAAGTEYTLVKVVERSVETLPLDSATVTQLAPPAVNALGALILSQRPAGLPDIQVNPRFGQWDAELAQVVAAPAQL